jgi:hypothetical protein
VVTLKQICYLAKDACSKRYQKDKINVICYMYTYTTNTRFVNVSSMTLLAPNHNQCRFSLQKRCSLMHYMAVTDIGKPKQAIPFRRWESFLVHFVWAKTRMESAFHLQISSHYKLYISMVHGTCLSIENR